MLKQRMLWPELGETSPVKPRFVWAHDGKRWREIEQAPETQWQRTWHCDGCRVVVRVDRVTRTRSIEGPVLIPGTLYDLKRAEFERNWAICFDCLHVRGFKHGDKRGKFALRRQDRRYPNGPTQVAVYVRPRPNLEPNNG